MFQLLQSEQATFCHGERLRRRDTRVKPAAGLHASNAICKPPRSTARTVAVSVLLSLGLCLSPDTPAQSKEKTASVSTEVAAGKWTGTRFRNLPQGASLAIELTVDGDVTVMLLDEQSYRRLPAVHRPLFHAKTGDRIAFSIVIPKTGHYYAVIDNRAGDTARQFTIDVKAAAAGAHKNRQARAVDVQLGTITDTLRQAFVFDSLVIRAAECGGPSAFSGANPVIICSETARELVEILGDQRKAADALMFMLLHEVGHVLLRQWEYPFHNNEEVVDEFATVLMVMFMGEKRVRSQAEYFASANPTSEVRQKLTTDNRHQLSLQRARNTLNWVDDPKLVYNWQPVMVPHMQTAFLERLKDQPRSWTSRELVERELLLRY